MPSATSTSHFFSILFRVGMGGDIDMLVSGCVARYTSRLPWAGTYLVLPCLSTALSSRRSFVRIKSHRPSCVRSSATRARTWTHSSLIFNLQLCITMFWVSPAAGQRCLMYRMRYVSLPSQVRRRTSSNSPGDAAKDSGDYGGAWHARWAHSAHPVQGAAPSAHPCISKKGSGS